MHGTIEHCQFIRLPLDSLVHRVDVDFQTVQRTKVGIRLLGKLSNMGSLELTDLLLFLLQVELQSSQLVIQKLCRSLSVPFALQRVLLNEFLGDPCSHFHGSFRIRVRERYREGFHSSEAR